jgi:DNA-directed RNA polymerase specialized sigma24 family protein
VQLVQRCLAREPAAWDELFERYHLRLLQSIQFLLGSRARDHDTVEEIAARVWYALLREDADALRRFDGERNRPLTVYIHAIARYETWMLLRADRRRKNREITKGRLEAKRKCPSRGEFETILRDFANTLTAAEREFLENSLLANPRQGPNPLGLSDASVWERRSRIRKKIRRFFR